MRRTQLARITVAVVGGGFAALAILALLMLVNADLGFSRCTATTGLGWTLPLLTGGLVSFVAWMLLREDTGSGPDVPVSETCTICGGLVMPGWRLCPHCGSPDPVPSSEAPGPAV